jgi:hypothetical protein
MKDEKKILRDALKEITNYTGLKIEANENFIYNPEIDVELKMRVKNKEIKFCGQIKNWITKNTIGHILPQVEKYKCVLITRYVPRELAEELKDKNVQFLDTAGNAYINIPPIFIYITGNKKRVKDIKPRPLRLFRKAGLKVLFVILNKPDLLNEPYRNIAFAGNTALGTVANVFTDLKKLRYLVEMGEHGRKLLRKDELLEKWVANYNEILRPTILKGKYNTNKLGWWREIDPKEYDIYWGGEIGANFLTKHLKPKIETIYTNQNINKLILKNRFIKNETGDVEILEKFWNFNYREENINIVPPLLIYADLIRIPDERNIATAKIIYEQEIFKVDL